MFSTLHSSRGLAASLTLAACLFNLTGAAVLAEPSALETVSLTPEERIIAHHAGEDGAAGATILGGTTTLNTTVSGQVSKQSHSDSLWGHMLLDMAYHRDPELQAIAKRVGIVNGITNLSIMGIAGLGLAQSIYSFNMEHPHTAHVEDDHVHLPHENKTPLTLGLISGATTVGTLAFRSAFSKMLTRKYTTRQARVKADVESVLNRLEDGVATQDVQHELTRLVGERAAGEFLMLWRAVHPTITTATAN